MVLTADMLRSRDPMFRATSRLLSTAIIRIPSGVILKPNQPGAPKLKFTVTGPLGEVVVPITNKMQCVYRKEEAMVMLNPKVTLPSDLLRCKQAEKALSRAIQGVMEGFSLGVKIVGVQKLLKRTVVDNTTWLSMPGALKLKVPKGVQVVVTGPNALSVSGPEWPKIYKFSNILLRFRKPSPPPTTTPSLKGEGQKSGLSERRQKKYLRKITAQVLLEHHHRGSTK